ncbi:MAG: hypothetical protein IK102_04555 [Treponema sp.]|nr:hypothetical protein [Treponema sp.]
MKKTKISFTRLFTVLFTALFAFTLFSYSNNLSGNGSEFDDEWIYAYIPLGQN